MTTHRIINCNSNKIKDLPDKSINLIVTSPPYPMIEMWDEMFGNMDATIKEDISVGKGMAAFEKMHIILDSIWKECDRVLDDNGFVCINIGDATRTINDIFQLYSNHTRIINTFIKMGYCVLPDIHWRKQTNSPNRFMGSGMYPAGAYVTYEHEYILIFRKGTKRLFESELKDRRQESAYFWEERNIWFSDLWEVKGTSQITKDLKEARERNASFPLEIPYRLIAMYSAYGDTVLDPFCGLGTTNIAAMILNRNSVGIEIDKNIANFALKNIYQSTPFVNEFVRNRLEKHQRFIESLDNEKKDKCYNNEILKCLVKTKQETKIKFYTLSEAKIDSDNIICNMN